MNEFEFMQYVFAKEQWNEKEMFSFITEKVSSFIDNPSKQNFNKIIQEVIQKQVWLAPLLIFPTIDRDCTPLIIKAYTLIRNHVPEDERYDLFCTYYTTSGFNFPKYLIQEVKKFRPRDYLNNLPDEFKSMETITIYRSSAISPIAAFGK